MDDRFLNEQRRDPDPQFARGLRERLRAQEKPRRSWAPRLAPVFASALAVVLAVALFTLPSVRASAQAMLDLFRVRKFAAVQFDESRIDKLRALEQDRQLMVFDQPQVIRDPGPAQVVPSVDAATATAGFRAARPTYLPSGLYADTVRVEGAGEARLTVSEAKIRAVLDALDLHDVTLPQGIDGKSVEVRKAPIVIQQFKSSGRLRAMVLQSNTPEIGVPAGMDIPRLAEVGLRILGLDAGEARRIANTTDWRTTLLVPVPLNASTFRQVTVHGEQGLLITTSELDQGSNRRREGTVLLWSEGDRVFAVRGNLGDKDVMQLAESMQ